MLTARLGGGAVLQYYGGGVFGLQAVGAEAVRTGDVGLLGLAGAVRFGPFAAGLFGVGIVLLAASGVLVALAVARSGRAPAWAGVPLAAALLLFLPQFFAPPALRIAHGVLLARGAWCWPGGCGGPDRRGSSDGSSRCVGCRTCPEPPSRQKLRRQGRTRGGPRTA